MYHSEHNLKQIQWISIHIFDSSISINDLSMHTQKLHNFSKRTAKKKKIKKNNLKIFLKIKKKFCKKLKKKGKM